MATVAIMITMTKVKTMVKKVLMRLLISVTGLIIVTVPTLAMDGMVMTITMDGILVLVAIVRTTIIVVTAILAAKVRMATRAVTMVMMIIPAMMSRLRLGVLLKAVPMAMVTLMGIPKTMTISMMFVLMMLQWLSQRCQ